MSVEKRIKVIMSDILEVKVESINIDFKPKDAPLWDSMNNLILITALEDEFNIKFTMDEIRSMINFDIITRVIKHYVENNV